MLEGQGTPPGPQSWEERAVKRRVSSMNGVNFIENKIMNRTLIFKNRIFRYIVI